MEIKKTYYSDYLKGYFSYRYKYNYTNNYKNLYYEISNDSHIYHSYLIGKIVVCINLVLLLFFLFCCIYIGDYFNVNKTIFILTIIIIMAFFSIINPFFLFSEYTRIVFFRQLLDIYSVKIK